MTPVGACSHPRPAIGPGDQESPAYPSRPAGALVLLGTPIPARAWARTHAAQGPAVSCWMQARRWLETVPTRRPGRSSPTVPGLTPSLSAASSAIRCMATVAGKPTRAHLAGHRPHGSPARPSSPPPPLSPPRAPPQRSGARAGKSTGPRPATWCRPAGLPLFTHGGQIAGPEPSGAQNDYSGLHVARRNDPMHPRISADIAR